MIWKLDSILFLAVLLFGAGAVPADLGAIRTDEIDLKGTWQLALDRSDVGVKEQWFKRKFSDPIQLPGTLRDNGYGDEITATTEWMSGLHDKYWYLQGRLQEIQPAWQRQNPVLAAAGTEIHRRGMVSTGHHDSGKLAWPAHHCFVRASALVHNALAERQTHRL